MKLPPRQLTPTPHVQRRAENGEAGIHSGRRDRTPPKPTVPMRAVHDDLAIPQAPADDDLAIPLADAAPNSPLQSRAPITGPVQPFTPITGPVQRAPNTGPVQRAANTGPVQRASITGPVQRAANTGPVQRAPTLPLVALSMRPPADIVVGTPAPPASPRGRKLWLAGSIAAVAIAAVSLFVVRSTTDSRPRASAAPAAKRSRAVAPQPLERPRVRHAAPTDPPTEAAFAKPVEADVDPATKASDEAAVPEKKSRRSAVKKEPRPEVTSEPKPETSSGPKPAKKWDPDALFPQ
jgi:hypothetical protein